MSPEIVQENIPAQTPAETVHAVADEVKSTVLMTAGGVAAEVTEVSEQLSEHAEASEERHTEILEGQQWLENQFQSIQSHLETYHQSLTTQITALTAILTNQSLSMALNPSTPATPPEPIAAIVEVIPEAAPPPESGVEDHPAAPTRARAKRKLI